MPGVDEKVDRPARWQAEEMECQPHAEYLGWCTAAVVSELFEPEGAAPGVSRDSERERRTPSLRSPARGFVVLVSYHERRGVGQDQLHGAHRLTHAFRGGASRLATAGGKSECLGEAAESPPPPCRSAPGPSENVERYTQRQTERERVTWRKSRSIRRLGRDSVQIRSFSEARQENRVLRGSVES